MWLRHLSFCLVLITFAAKGQDIADVQAAFEREDYDLVVSLVDSALSVTTVINKPGLYQLRADAYYYKGNLEKSLEDYFRAINHAENSEVRDLTLLIECYSHSGFCYREMGLIQKAFPHYEHSLKLAKEKQDSVEIASQYYNLGTLYERAGVSNTAVAMLDSAYRIDAARKDTTALGFDLNLLSGLKARAGENEVALEYAKQSLQLYQAGTGNANSRANRVSMIGSIFLQMGALDSAEYYIQNAMQDYGQLGDSNRYYSRWIDMAAVENKKQNYSKAIAWAEKAKYYFSAQDESRHFIRSNNVLAEAFGGLLLFDKALAMLKQTEQKCKNLGLTADLQENLTRQLDLLTKMGNEQEAIELRKEHQVLSDSIASMEDKNQMRQLELQIRLDKLEQENNILTEKNLKTTLNLQSRNLQMQWLIWSSAILLVLGLVGFLNFRARIRRRNKQLQLEINELRIQIKSLLEGDTSELQVDLNKLNNCLNEPLTDREFEILNHAIGDLNNSEIAEKVYVSVNTVKYHLKKIYDKLGVSNRKQALEYVVKLN